MTRGRHLARGGGRRHGLLKWNIAACHGFELLVRRALTLRVIDGPIQVHGGMRRDMR